MAYAESTSVPVERSKAEIERILQRYGASQFVAGWDKAQAVIGFTASNRQVRFVLPLPSPDDPGFSLSVRTTNGRKVAKKVTPERARAAYEQEVRRRWRTLALAIKSKLATVESGIATFEQEFLHWIMLPDGQSVGDFMSPQLEDAYSKGLMPRALPGLPAAGESSAGDAPALRGSKS